MTVDLAFQNVNYSLQMDHVYNILTYDIFTEIIDNTTIGNWLPSLRPQSLVKRKCLKSNNLTSLEITP